MKPKSIFTVALWVFLSSPIIARAQILTSPPAPEARLRSSAELDQLLGPIALYPDPLIAQMLPAATLPSEIVLADRYVNGGGDPNLIDQQPWAPSVKALARYPLVLKWMDDSLAWTEALGQAFLSQQQDVMASVQRLRAQAQALGNLETTPEENVVTDDGIIEILPVNPQVIYVPMYQPEMVYFQRPYSRPFVSFGIGCAVGPWLNHDFDWRNHRLIVWHRDRPRPGDWWIRRPGERPPIGANHPPVWQPRMSPGPATRGMDRGWGSRPVRSTVTVIGRGQSRRAEGHITPVPSGRRSQPVIVPHSAEAPRSRPANGALIGVQSSHGNRQFGSRGQESRQTTMSRPAAPAAHPSATVRSAAPAARPSATVRSAAPAVRPSASSHSVAPHGPSGGGRR